VPKKIKIIGLIKIQKIFYLSKNPLSLRRNTWWL